MKIIIIIIWRSIESFLTLLATGTQDRFSWGANETTRFYANRRKCVFLLESLRSSMSMLVFFFCFSQFCHVTCALHNNRIDHAIQLYTHTFLRLSLRIYPGLVDINIDGDPPTISQLWWWSLPMIDESSLNIFFFF